MSFHLYRVNRLADEEKLLREQLKMENGIRKHRERKRQSKAVASQKYSRIFEPVTKSLDELKDIQKAADTVNPQPEENLIDLGDNKADGDLIDIDDVPFTKEEAEEKPGELFLEALASIPVRYLDDGVFGLNIKTGKIGSYKFSVKGDRLTVRSMDSIKQYDINDYDLWRLLLVTRPNQIGLDLKSIEGREVLKRFLGIVHDLDLVQDAESRGLRYQNRAKYKLLLHGEKIGSGTFLFTARPPPQLIHPSTVVIPSDNKGLLRALLQAVAELRAGNTSMQNIVVPLAQEAKRKKILPLNLLSPDEMTWVFA